MSSHRSRVVCERFREEYRNCQLHTQLIGGRRYYSAACVDGLAFWIERHIAGKDAIDDWRDPSSKKILVFGPTLIL